MPNIRVDGVSEYLLRAWWFLKRRERLLSREDLKKTRIMTRTKVPGLDDRLPLKEILRFVPGRSPHYLTAYRWATRGIQCDGETITLRTERVGRRRLTTRKWLAEFLAALQDDDAVRDELLAPARQRVDAALDAELA